MKLLKQLWNFIRFLFVSKERIIEKTQERLKDIKKNVHKLDAINFMSSRDAYLYKKGYRRSTLSKVW